MKKKLLTILLLGTLLTSCGSVDSSKETTTTNDTAEVQEDNSELKSVKKDDNIELLIPSDFVDATTQEELDNIVKEKGFVSATLNPDGSANYVLTKSKHKELMKEVTEELNTSLNEMINSEECPNITDIRLIPILQIFPSLQFLQNYH